MPKNLTANPDGLSFNWKDKVVIPVFLTMILAVSGAVWSTFIGSREQGLFLSALAKDLKEDREANQARQAEIVKLIAELRDDVSDLDKKLAVEMATSLHKGE